ncbi:hypothetical protein BK770_05130 [Bacillus thuringiensis serovar colmeri]|nr:hypothetical protein BK760_25430 [Bacillus thuringiensis serovar tolworthi]OUA03487.1 hypothetical protein BK770_05130 [Bacillus thuringiensis serovar colmeri]OUA19878.1 hypothetical protein BK777_19055 [Bacillus thuringiensis serovar aizawai]
MYMLKQAKMYMFILTFTPPMILKYFKCILAFLQKNREDISHYIIKRKNKLVYKLVCFCILLDLTIHWINKKVFITLQ